MTATDVADARAPRASGPRQPLRRAAASLALLAFSLGLALFLAEGAVRLVAPQQLIFIRPDIWQPVDSLGWVNRPNLRTTINTGERTVSLFTDEHGMRVGAAGQVDAETRVLLIGDSFMQALQVEHEESFAALLEAGLTRNLGRPVAVWNAGVDGWDPPQYLIRTRQLLAAHRFDLVIVALYLGNDVVARRVDRVPPRAPAERHRLRAPRQASWREVVDALIYPLNDWLEMRSHLFVFAKRGLQPVLMKAGLTAEYFPVEFLKREAVSPRWDVTAELSRELAEEAARAGTPALFALIPTPFQVTPEVFDNYVRGFGINPDSVDLEQPNRLLAPRLASAGLATLDVLPEFRQQLVTSGRQLYGEVDRHLTARGHVELARLVAPAALERVRGTRSRARPGTRR